MVHILGTADIPKVECILQIDIRVIFTSLVPFHFAKGFFDDAFK